MRTSRTFVLRVLVDPDEPAELRGLIHSVASGEGQTFFSGRALLVVLRRMLKTAPGAPPYDLAAKDKEEEQ